MTDAERSPRERPEDKDDAVARKRDELLDQARGKAPIGFGAGADPRLMGLGIQFVIAILLCLYAGMWLDAKLHSAPWFMLIGAMLGAGAGFYSMFRVLMSEDKRIDDEEKKEK